MIGIYKITNKINGKYYIGSSRNIEDRLKRHFIALKNNTHKNKHLQSAYDKYGHDNFYTEVLEECSLSDLITREQYYIDSGNWSIMYNKTRQAYGGGSDAMSKELILLDLEGNVVDVFPSGREISRFLNYKRDIDYCSINTDIVVRRMYRIVSPQFFESNKDIIYSWKNYDEIYEKSW